MTTRAKQWAERDALVLAALVPGVQIATGDVAACAGLAISAARRTLERLERDGRVTRLAGTGQGWPDQWRR